MYSLLLTQAPVHLFRIRTINTHPSNGIPEPHTQTNQTPPRKKAYLGHPNKAPTTPDMPHNKRI